MCNNVRVFNANGIPLWHDINNFTRKKTNGNGVINCLLFSVGIVNRIRKISFGPVTPESNNRILCIDLKCMEMLEYGKGFDDSPSLSFEL